MARTSDKFRLYLTLTSLPNDQFHWALVLAPKDPPGEWLYDVDGHKDLIVYEARHDPPWRYCREETNYFRINPLNRILLGKFADRASADRMIHTVVRQVAVHTYNFDSQTWTRRAMRALARRGVIHIVPLDHIEEVALDRAEYCANAQLAGVLVNYRAHTLDMRSQGVWSKIDPILARPMS